MDGYMVGLYVQGKMTFHIVQYWLVGEICFSSLMIYHPSTSSSGQKNKQMTSSMGYILVLGAVGVLE